MPENILLIVKYKPIFPIELMLLLSLRLYQNKMQSNVSSHVAVAPKMH